MSPKASIHLRMISHQSNIICMNIIQPPQCAKVIPTIIVVFIVQPVNGRRRNHHNSPGKLR
jgi:hypothetical protein